MADLSASNSHCALTNCVRKDMYATFPDRTKVLCEADMIVTVGRL
jgi:hypothetical protein